MCVDSVEWLTVKRKNRILPKMLPPIQISCVFVPRNKRLNVVNIVFLENRFFFLIGGGHVEEKENRVELIRGLKWQWHFFMYVYVWKQKMTTLDGGETKRSRTVLCYTNWFSSLGFYSITNKSVAGLSVRYTSKNQFSPPGYIWNTQPAWAPRRERRYFFIFFFWIEIIEL